MITATVCAMMSCGVDSTPGPLPSDQASYDEVAALSCVAMNGRSYAITLANGAPATDTIIFASDRIEAIGPMGTGFEVAPYACAQTDSLRITAELAGDSSRVLRFSAALLGESIQGTLTVVRTDSVANAVTAFMGRAIAGNATLRTPQRKVESY